MTIDLKGRSFLTLLDYTEEEIRYLLDLAKLYKIAKKLDRSHKKLDTKNIALIFEKDSIKTRCAFDVAAMDLGIGVTNIGANELQGDRSESIKDFARGFGKIYDGIAYYGGTQENLNELNEFAKIPIWNAMTIEYNPTQVLADLLTIEEKLGYLKGANLTFVGDTKNSVVNSLMIACAKMGINFTICAPSDLHPDKSLVNECKNISEKNKSNISLTENFYEGTKDADIIYTSSWNSILESNNISKDNIDKLAIYKVSMEIINNCNKKVIFMHCLPAFHNLETKLGRNMNKDFGIKEMEVSDDVFESDLSVVFEQSENRMHTIKAIIAATLGAEYK
ncbi:ornithine carbamoyltransferase [Paraclostridium bifermentans]|uniref:ornithine carbamoyltransferase n=1 Tax=Paraclostridium bifermentans TaxID=1490 RepID=UPI002149E058|nr:ornithine carbamoyltransferase [Paraclostridium bifermentans]MCR1875027.1 ornithine carbamoyltransferase [Paraclostridium bifermentans]